MLPYFVRGLSRSRLSAKQPSWAIIILLSLLPIDLPTYAQAECTAYEQCAALQLPSDTQLRGPIVFSFDESNFANMFESEEQANDFKNRLRDAAEEWSRLTGVSITEADPPGHATNVTISVSSSPFVQDSDGVVIAEGEDRFIIFSNEFSVWSAAGKDRAALHEWGHILGLEDLPPGSCPDVESIMRQNGPGPERSEIQNRQGYDCEVFSDTEPGDPAGCPDYEKLPYPSYITPCDIRKTQRLQCDDNDGDLITICEGDCNDNYYDPSNNCDGGGGGGGTEKVEYESGSGGGGGCTPWYAVYYLCYCEIGGGLETCDECTEQRREYVGCW
jgi:hypothetical protein